MAAEHLQLAMRLAHQGQGFLTGAGSAGSEPACTPRFRADPGAVCFTNLPHNIQLKTVLGHFSARDLGHASYSELCICVNASTYRRHLLI